MSSLSVRCVSGRSGMIHDITMGSCVFRCDVQHQWIAQRLVGRVSVYCDGVGWGVMSGVCGMAFMCGKALVKVSLLQAGTVLL